MSTACPSRFRLEQYEESDGVDLALAQHVQSCAACQQALATMRRQAADYSGQPHSLAARQAFVGADRRWKRNAALLVALPLALLTVVLGATLLRSPAPSLVAQGARSPHLQRQAREVVEVRPSVSAPKLRALPLRGGTVAFGQGSLEGSAPDGTTRPFVLTHTDVQIDVLGFVSTVQVTQEFTNPFETPVEAIYVFPLPEDSAVDELTLTAGSHVLRASIQKREEARRRYEEAKSQGRRAALLDEERPNIFTQSVANLLPHETVKVTLHYVAPLRYDDGEYTLDFPMVVGPRYMAGAPLTGTAQGTGTEPDTDRVPDASRLSPPLERTGRDVAITVNLDAAAPIEGLWSGSHRLLVDRASASRATITLDGRDSIPNRDLVLSWAISGAQKRASLVAAGGPGGTFALMLTPEVQAQQQVLAREMVFVIDTSCSMSGPPLQAAKDAMALAIEQLNPDDTFLLIDFADTASSFSPAPLPNTKQNVAQAIDYLRRLPASGGTNQLAGILAALDRPADPRRLRTVLLMTDGYIGSDDEVFAAASRHLGEARLFGVGIGSAVNHHLLRRLSEEGRGFYQFIDPEADPRPAIERFVRRLRRPLLRDVEIDWGALEVFDVVPPRVPDLFDAQPLVVLARSKRPGKATVTVRGLIGAERYEQRLEVELPEQDTGARGLTAMWARAKIEALSRSEPSPEVNAEITTLGLEHHLVTQFTSLVATEEVPVTNQPGRTAVIPSEPPALTQGFERRLEQKRMNTIQIIRGSAAPDDDGVEGGVAHRPPTVAVRPVIAGDGDDFESAFGSVGKKPRAEVDPGHHGSLDVSGQVLPMPKERLAASDVLEVVIKQKAKLQACVEAEHRAQPGLTGKLVLRWRISTLGVVSEVTVLTPEFESAPIAACITEVVKHLQFPAHSIEGDPVTFPFTF